MNKGLTYKAIKHRKLTIFMMLVTLIIGTYSYIMLPRQESPDISVPGAQIIVVYPGASPADMEAYVTDVIEDELTEIEGYESSESVSKSNLSSIMLFLDDSADKDAAWDDLDDVMAEVEGDLPDGVTKVIVNTEVMETPGMIIGITGENYRYEELADYADYFKDSLAKINGVSRFDVYGDIDKEIEVVLDHELIDQYGLTLQQVISLLKAENVTMPTGAIDNGSSKIEVSLDSEFNRVEDIENTVVMNLGDGRQVRLKDIGVVNHQNDPDDSRFSKNGDKAVYLAGFFNESLNVVMVGEEVKAEIERLKVNIPDDIDFFFMVYHPHDVEKSINDFMVNLVQAVVFVIVVVFFGMGWRNAVVVSTVIPLSISFTMVAMYFMGVKLEQMSIAGLIIALGMLVDNAIVVSDAIQYHIDEGIDNFKAAIMGTKEVAFSILTSTLTTIFAFMPLLLLDSSIGQFVYGVPYVVTVAIIASYICALITTPVIAGMTFHKTTKHKEKKVSKLRKFILNLLKSGLSHKKRTIALSIIFVILSVFFIKGLEMTLLPKADKVMLQIDLTSELASDLNKTEELANQAIDILKDVPELKDYYVSVGSNLPKFYLSVMYRADSPDIAQIAYTFDISESDQFMSKEELQEYVQSILSKELIGGTASTLLLELGSFGRPIEFEITGNDLDRLDEVRYELISKMQSMESIVNIDDDFSSKEYQFYADVDETKASYYGFTKYDIQSEVTAALMGMDASTFKKDGDETPIIVTSDITSIKELENLGIRSNISGKRLRLKDLAEVEIVTEFPVINHGDGERSVTITSDVAPGYSNKKVEQELKDFVESGDYGDLEFDFDGMMATMMESNMAILQLGVLALFMILAVLILQFDSYRQPLVVLAIIPLAFACALLGLFLSRQELSFVAMLSLLALMGIVVNNAIVLLDCINVLLSEGMSMEEACIVSVNRRYRPITLSTTTTVIGLIPLLISGGELFRPLAITLMSGLGLSMVLTMVIIPTVYSLLMSKKENKVRKIQMKSNF